MKLVYHLLSEDLIENLGVVKNCADSGFVEDEPAGGSQPPPGLMGN
ncbi:MAG: hypothetical protein K0B01_11035 [Syntrophobacterales bacterium]|nr:hypothetical protein [Syntrophobacterales bacterium]